MQGHIEFTDLISTNESVIGHRLSIKGYLVVEVGKCYLLEDEDASEYSAKIEVYAPGLEKKIRESPAGIHANMGGAATYFGYAIITGVLCESRR